MELSYLIEKLLLDKQILIDEKMANVSIRNLQGLPLEVQIDELRITKSMHAYGFNYRVEVFEFFGDCRSYRELGLFLLATVIFGDDQDRLIHLTNVNSEIKAIRIPANCDQTQAINFFLELAPQELKKHPWEKKEIIALDLPVFNRTNAFNFCRTEKDWGERNWLVLAGNSKSNILLAKLLLELGHPENHCLEVALEIEGGFRGVGPCSEEARFWMPDSFGWE